MKKKYIFGLSIFLIALLMLSNVSAFVQYFQRKSVRDGNILEWRVSVFWQQGASHPDGDEDSVSKGNPLDLYLRYDILTETWNTDNPEYSVQNCNITIFFDSYLTNSSEILFHQNYINEDGEGRKYFVRMRNLDSMAGEIECLFNGTIPEGLEMPANIGLTTPTWECKACQFYEWSVLQRDLAKAEALGNNRVETIDYMKELFLINYSAWIIIFWLILLSFGFVAISLIFIGLYWLFIFLRKISKDI